MDAFGSTSGAAGVDAVEIGGLRIKVEPPKTREVLTGYGETIRVGDVAYCYVYERGRPKRMEGPFKVVAIGADDQDPWFSFIRPDGSRPVANYTGDIWRREFQVASPAITQQLNAALQFCNKYVRLYVTFNNLATPARPTLIPACFIAWVGDLQKAFREYSGPFGPLKKKNIVRWNKKHMFTSHEIKSKIPIPDNFPVSLE